MSLASLTIRAGRNLFLWSKGLPKTRRLEQFIKKAPKVIDNEGLGIKKAVPIHPKKYVPVALKEIEFSLGGLKMKMIYNA